MLDTIYKYQDKKWDEIREQDETKARHKETQELIKSMKRLGLAL
jgi:hypothetical protein